MTDLYAIPVAKGWVEIRRCTKPPKVKKSETVKTIQEEKLVLDYSTYGYHYKLVPKKLKFTVMTFTGGKLLKTVKASRFAKLTKARVRQGEYLQLSEDMAKQVLETW